MLMLWSGLLGGLAVALAVWTVRQVQRCPVGSSWPLGALLAPPLILLLLIGSVGSGQAARQGTGHPPESQRMAPVLQLQADSPPQVSST
ncbi:hypothetical protein GO986_22200 [Deinococcus sp. HMF7620]|uniref:Uncharacterized protein n=1 Tax=Deinococcus arboris TaxID=2682977 RepID=A0A7C9I268_9DEIO|nr:hypothetical protein [Deinococcus arboris]MVN89450.1 hypothetical protein [Deinococcus arboris]